MNRIKEMLKGRNISIPSLIIKIVIIWFILAFFGISEFKFAATRLYQRWRVFFSGNY